MGEWHSLLRVGLEIGVIKPSYYHKRYKFPTFLAHRGLIFVGEKRN